MSGRTSKSGVSVVAATAVPVILWLVLGHLSSVGLARPQPQVSVPRAGSGRALQARAAMKTTRHVPASLALLSSQGGRMAYEQQQQQQQEYEKIRSQPLFHCDEPTRALYDNFVRQYNRTFADDSDKLERLNLFAVTLKRAILFNRVIQAEILKAENYLEKPEIRNYHFVEATSGQNAALWFVDITDCELGLIKKTIFDIFYHLDANDYAEAWRVVQLNKDYLPSLLSDDGFEQLVNILLLRLYDRFRGDQTMNQLFAWPLYLKKLAAFAYNQQLAAQPGHKTKMALISFAYPAYFKDLKYNLPAINRTGDNVRANQEHELFFSKLRRQFTSHVERNKRLAVFRQRWSLINQLNSNVAAGGAEDELLLQRSRQASQLPDWQRVRYKWESTDDLPIEYNATRGFGDDAPPTSESSASQNAQLKATPERETDSSSSSSSSSNEPNYSDQVAARGRRHFKLTQFSDLTDVEFVAFLSNDFSLLDGNRDSADYLERNFPLRPLDSKLRWELAHELELRRNLAMTTNELQLVEQQQAMSATGEPLKVSRNGLKLAKQVVDELISDVGLPIGPATVDNIQEAEHFRVFEMLARAHRKPYVSLEAAGGKLSASDLADERQRRYETFKQNHGRFRAWFTKNGWALNDSQMVTMLRLADMSWLEIKLTVFRICCLTGDNLRSLSARNATIQYLATNYESLCHQFSDVESPTSSSSWGNNAPLPQQQQQTTTTTGSKSAEILAEELYYYYSVHFNKHQTNANGFERRFEIFRRNIDSIRHHSCMRSLTLHESFRLKRPDLLATIDVTDPRRSHTDDLNLDRFEYFKLPASLADSSRLPTDLLDAPEQHQHQHQHQHQQAPASAKFREPLESSRAAISYGRDHFSRLYQGDLEYALIDSQAVQQPNQRPPTANGAPPLSPTQSYFDKLHDSLQNSNVYASRYRENRVWLVYELVMARYRFCMKNYENIDLDGTGLRQQCQANGPLGDGALRNNAVHLYESLEPTGSAGGGFSGRLQQGGGLSGGGQRDTCAYYRQGLEPWSAGLIRQADISVQLIREARCT